MRRALALLAGCIAAAVVATPAAAVVGGSPATPGSFPSLAFISDNLGGGETAYCTGTVVSPDVVMTAAHCLVNDSEALEPPGGFSVTTGTLDPSQDPGQTYAASAVAIDPSFNPSVDSSDAGVIVLATTTSAPPVTLADAADAAELANPLGVGIVIAGWGLTSEGATAEPATLQTAPMTTQTGFYCSQHGADLGFDESSEFCAPGAGTVAVCNGDSGGPAFAQGAGGDEIELGMIDRDAGCDPTQPSIFTSVDAVAAWVQGEIAANPPLSQAAAPAASSTSPAPAPAGTATPAGSTDPPRFTPLSGSYAGRSSQRHGRVELSFTAGSLSGARLEFNARCRGAWRGPIIRTRTWPAGAIELLAAAGGGGGWSLAAHYDAGGYRFVLSGTLPASGGASGTLSATSAHPSCASGVVSWHATVVG